MDKLCSAINTRSSPPAEHRIHRHAARDTAWDSASRRGTNGYRRPKSTAKSWLSTIQGRSWVSQPRHFTGDAEWRLHSPGTEPQQDQRCFALAERNAEDKRNARDGVADEPRDTHLPHTGFFRNATGEPGWVAPHAPCRRHSPATRDGFCGAGTRSTDTLRHEILHAVRRITSTSGNYRSGSAKGLVLFLTGPEHCRRSGSHPLQTRRSEATRTCRRARQSLCGCGVAVRRAGP